MVLQPTSRPPHVADRIVSRVGHNQRLIVPDPDLCDDPPPALRIKILAHIKPRDALHGVTDLLRLNVVQAVDLSGNLAADPQPRHPYPHGQNAIPSRSRSGPLSLMARRQEAAPARASRLRDNRMPCLAPHPRAASPSGPRRSAPAAWGGSCHASGQPRDPQRTTW